MREIQLSDYTGKYLILYFYTNDVSESFHKDILDMSDNLYKFQEINCEILGCSTDSKYVHEKYCT